MINMLQHWKGALEVNGTYFESFDAFKGSNFAPSDEIHIKLYPKGRTALKSQNSAVKQEDIQSSELVITVKQYMTKKSCPEFDFMAKWNNDNPIPLRTMVGTKDKETPGMVYMKLHGDILSETTCNCMKCGKVLTNPVSQYFGIGPECGGHNYVHPFDTDEELKAAVASYRKHLQEVTWEGWIIKSAITSQEERR